jgi:DNA polymerase-3 subunit beta
MKFTCAKNDLLKTLQVVSKALPGATPLPELTHFLFEVQENEVKISATNLKTFISSKVKADVESPGDVLIQGQFFLEVLQTMSTVDGTTVVLERLENGRVLFTLEEGSRRYELAARDRAEYPAVELIQPGVSFKMAGKELTDLLKFGQIGATQSEHSVQGFKGVCIDIKSPSFSVVSTDGMRMASITKKLEGLGDLNTRWLLSLEATTELSRILPDEELEICQNGNKILVRFQSTVFQTVLSEGDFVDYEDYVPDDLGEGILLDTASFQNNLKSLLPLARDTQYKVVFELRDSILGIRSFSEKLGEGYCEIEVEPCGHNLDIGLNAKYVMDFLNNAGSTSVRFYADDGDMPGYFWSDSNTDEHHNMCVIMSVSLA